MTRAFSILTSAFPLRVLAASIVALIEPAIFTSFSGPLVPLGLGIIMLGTRLGWNC